MHCEETGGQARLHFCSTLPFYIGSEVIPVELVSVSSHTFTEVYFFLLFNLSSYWIKFQIKVNWLYLYLMPH